MHPIREILSGGHTDNSHDKDKHPKKKKNVLIQAPPYTTQLPTPSLPPSSSSSSSTSPPFEPVDIYSISKDYIRPVNYNDFIKSLKNIRPSVNVNSIKKYEDWNKKFGAQ
jgi:SpoVK/Ycf46/Vps4 family AAA+-type ATPase